MKGWVEPLCSSVSNIRPVGEQRRRTESVGGRSDLPGVVFLPFIWTGIGIQFQLSVLHLLKHTQTHNNHPVRWKEQRMLEKHRDPPEAPVQLCGTAASGKGLHTDYNTHTQLHCSKLHYTHVHSQMQKNIFNTHLLPQMCNRGPKGRDHTNKYQGKGSWETLERQQSF